MSADRDQARAQRLRNMRWVAGGLLAAMAALYFGAGVWVRQAPWLGYVRAFAEAATVGACADWFAVTALFRRPLGLPIPHTGVIPRNKDRIGDALGAFIADSFLTAEILEARLRRLQVARWGAGWLRQRRNASMVAERLVTFLPELLALSTPEARRRFVGTLAADAIATVPAAPFAAGVLRAAWSGERGAAILDAGVDLAARLLAGNADLVRAEVAGRTYKWLPRWVDERIADTILASLERTLEDMRDAEHPLRGRIASGVEAFVARLESDPELAAKAEAIKQRIASHPALLERLGDLGEGLERRLRPSTEVETQALVNRLAGWLTGFGAWLYDEADTIEIFNDWALGLVGRSIAPRRRAIGRAIANVVAAWDTRTVVDKLELQIGADLQYIRINGTIVGGLAGLAIFTVSKWLGLR